MKRNLRPLIYGLVFVLVFTLLGFRITHPKSGLQSAAGPASSSLVVYRHVSEYSMGDKVVLRMPDDKKSPAIGIVKTVLDQSVQVQTGDLLLNISISDIRGKLFGVLPFIGIIFDLIGQ